MVSFYLAAYPISEVLFLRWALKVHHNLAFYFLTSFCHPHGILEPNVATKGAHSQKRVSCFSLGA